jgi:hypothetical protein
MRFGRLSDNKFIETKQAMQKKWVFFLFVALMPAFIYAQQYTINKRLVPEAIFYEGVSDIEYSIGNDIVALDYWEEGLQEGDYIRMNISGKEVHLKCIHKKTTKFKRFFEGDGYQLELTISKYGECVGEGAQQFFGKMLIKQGGEKHETNFTGSDSKTSSKKCQEMGNG